MEPVEVMAEYAAAWERGEAEAAWQFYADDVVMNLPGRGWPALTSAEPM
ncbi:MAG TPA: hypothetical protein VIC07_11435 [Acidimicrobiia bacterium]|jgi:ketosteroid isomerase-like protein